MIVADLAVAFIAAVLMGLGVGSGGIYLLWLTLVENVAQRAAQGQNLLFSVAALASGAATNFRHGRIPLRPFLLVLLPGMAGAALGAIWSFAVPVAVLRRGLSLALIAGGAAVLFSSRKAGKRRFVPLPRG